VTGARRYRAFGRVLECDQPLPELPQADPSDVPNLRIRWPCEFDIRRDLRWSVVGRSRSNAPLVTFARSGAVSFMRFGAGVDVRVSPGGAIDISSGAAPGDASARHMLLDHALPLALAAAGETVLHASAVLIDERAVLFLGEAGTGKSTLAATLAREGCTVFADDGVLVEERNGAAYAVASYPGLRLWPDAADTAGVDESALLPVDRTSAKRRLVPGHESPGHRPGPVPIARIYSLALDEAATTLTRLSRRDAVVELVRHAFTAEPDDRAAIQAQLDRMVRWSAELDVWRAAYRRDLAEAPAVAAALIAHVRGELSADD
jgi:hypothetical protein